MNSKECNFSFETNFERTTDEFRKNVIRTNNLPRLKIIIKFKLYLKLQVLNLFYIVDTKSAHEKQLKILKSWKVKKTKKIE